MNRLAIYGYTGFYYVYLFLFPNLETEQMHWLTLVLVPFTIFWFNQPNRNLSSVLDAVMLKGQLTKGIVVAILVGLLLGALQLFLSRDSYVIMQQLREPSGWIRWFKAAGLILITAGFTEEFFFRGILLSVLYDHTKSKGWAISISSSCFGVFHIPYELSKHNPAPLLPVVLEAVTFPILFGMLLGFLVMKYNNLLVSVLIHTLFNSFWAVRLF